MLKLACLALQHSTAQYSVYVRGHVMLVTILQDCNLPCPRLTSRAAVQRLYLSGNHNESFGYEALDCVVAGVYSRSD